MEKKDFKEIKELGFSSLIDRFKKYSGAEREEIKKGIDDDAAVFRNEKGRFSTISSELFLEGIHFDVTYTPLQHLGSKVVTAAVSDIYAMNSIPQQLLVDIAIPNKYSVQMVEALYEGLDAAAKDYNIQISGGDTTASHQLLTISVTATGTADEEQLIYRNNAGIGDAICVTGDLGSAIAGLRILMREKKEWQEKEGSHFQPELEPYEYVVQRQLVPRARKDLIDLLQKLDFKPTSMIDITKGLVAELKEIGKQSGLGIEIYSPAVPIALETRQVADEMKEDVDKYAFYGGEDYEMLFTLPEPLVEKLMAEFEDFTVIGKMTNHQGKLKVETGEEQSYEFDI
ncbi:MAG: thiamine-phosphate kinase [Bacteroidetes bacterium]|jgi:thiamine-monophosphate kinase|nr:thiamine-phosphate kinase [Bacteroidota bacterium]